MSRIRIPMPSMLLPANLPELTTLAMGKPIKNLPDSRKQFCVDPEHHTVHDCAMAAATLQQASSGPQQCLLVGMTNAALAFADLTSPAKVADKPLASIIEATAELWRSTELAISRTGPYLAQNASVETLQGLLDAYLYFGTVEQQRNAAIVLYSQHKPKLLLLNTLLGATPGVGWLAKGLQQRQVLATRERTDYAETNSINPA